MLQVMAETFEEVGMLIEPDKNEGPVTVITFPGLQLDTDKLEIRLPPERLTKARSETCCLSLPCWQVPGDMTRLMRHLINLTSMASQMDGSRVVAPLPRELNWHCHDDKQHQADASPSTHVRCLRKLVLRGLLRQQLVHAPIGQTRSGAATSL